MSELTSYRLDGRIARIVMDDGKVNALSPAMLRALNEALDQAERDRAVVLLSGRDGCLSAGFDLKVFVAGGEQLLEMLRLGAGLVERMLSFPTPVAVACTGHALAAGSFLLAAADTRIGVDGPFQIGLNEVKIGLTVPWFAIELARYRLQPAYFDATVVNARTYNPVEALSAGFLDRVVAADELAQAASEAAGALAELDPGAHAATKLRARGSALTAIRAAIASELTEDGLQAGRPPS